MPDLNAARWTEIRRLLDEARALSPADRAAFLDAATDDPELREEVGDLLAADLLADTDGFLDTPAPDRAVALFGDADDPYLGRRAGPWHLDARLGEGGMGVVYCAHRADADFEQTAALKLVGRGLAPRAVLDRFRRERRILARLAHPHIARLLDGGITDDGQPYFAMELVNGEPLTRYAEARDLDVPDRLRLILDVCDAVAYAHRNLVVHRDLKPSNVLVTEGKAGTPHVKLLDFGIAKLLREEDDEPLTRTGGTLMTPTYAAPEQVRGEAVTTATDVYSLGVLLYELLAGQRPYALEPSTPPAAVERVVCDTEPARLSSVAPGVWARRLQGDLDTIVHKALEKEPARRYPSAEALADDLRRHLDGLPITARRATVGYRVRSFVRRHPVGVGLSALTVLALVLGLAGTAWQARIAAAERDRARIEAAKAEEIRDYVLSLFAVANPDSARGRAVTVREVLDVGAERVATELAEQPLVRAELEMTIALLYRRLALYDRARPRVESAITLREEHLGSAHPNTAAAHLELARLLTDAGDYTASRAAADRAHAIYRAALGSDHPETLASLNSLAAALAEMGEHTDAEHVFAELAARHRAAGDSVALGEALHNLGSSHIRQLHFADAEAPLREAVTIRRALHGDLHSNTANSLNSLGLAVARGRGDLEEAEPLLEEALATRRRLYGDRHPEVAQMLNNLARLYEKRGDLGAAQAAYEELVPLVQAVLGASHPNTGTVLVNHGSLLRQRGRPADAEPLVREGLTIARAAYGPDHPITAEFEVHLARVLIALDRPTEARRLVTHALPLLEAAYGLEAPPVQEAREAEVALD